MTPNLNLSHVFHDRTQSVVVTRGDSSGGHYWYWFSAGMPAVAS